jgi:PhnB protein
MLVEKDRPVLVPYLFLDGRCEEAIDFYKKAIGAEVTSLMRFKENPEPSANPPGAGEKIMHASLRVGQTTIFASDGRNQGKPNFQGFALSIAVKTEAEAKKMFDGLAAGGRVEMPLGKTFFSPSFGMLADRFGVTWMVLIPTM